MPSSPPRPAPPRSGTVHPPARELLLLAVDNGWSASLVHGKDMGGKPFVTVTARRNAHPWQVIVTWHTRATDTYRLFTALVGQNQGAHDVSLTGARAALTTPPPQPERQPVKES